MLLMGEYNPGCVRYVHFTNRSRIGQAKKQQPKTTSQKNDHDEPSYYRPPTALFLSLHTSAPLSTLLSFVDMVSVAWQDMPGKLAKAPVYFMVHVVMCSSTSHAP